MAAKSSTGLKKETAAALAVVSAVTIVGPLLFIFLEKDKFVRFYAAQVIVVMIAAFVLQSLFALTIILLPLVPLVTVLGFVFWLIMVYKAWQGDMWEVPVLGKFTKKIIKG